MKANQFQRILALLLAAVLTVCLLPAAAFAAEAGDTPTETAQSVTDPPTEGTEPTEIPSDPTESAAPPVTEQEETIPPETDPVDTTAPTEAQTEQETPSMEATPEPTIPPAEDGPQEALPPETAMEADADIMPYAAYSGVWKPAAKLRLTNGHEVNVGGYRSSEAIIHRISAGGTIYAAFCLEPGVNISNGDPYSGASVNGDNPWLSLSAAQRETIGLILIHGAPNSITGAGPRQELAYELATRIAVHEVILGIRQTTPPYAPTSSAYLDPWLHSKDGSVLVDSAWADKWGNYASANGRLLFPNDITYAYNYINTKLAEYAKKPSFASWNAGDAPTHKMTANADGTYSVTLTDTSGALDLYTFANTSQLTFGKSGNTLTIRSTAADPGTVTGTRETPAPNGSSYILWTADNGQSQTVISLASAGQGSIPVYFKLEAPAAKITLKKSIDASPECIAQLQGNAMYSLAGAQYVIKLNGAVQETVTTNANGEATTSKSYNVGDRLTYQETAAPPGFKLDPNIYTYTVTAGENVISVKDEPILDPPFAITKVDKQTTDPQGNASFSGAIFKWEYFDNDSWSGSPVRTWYFKTDASGWAYYRPSYLAFGYANDALYVNASGDHEIPLGTVKITEIVNSLGYIVLPESLYCSIVADSSSTGGVDVIWTSESRKYIVNMSAGNFGVYEPIDENLFGSITLDKRDADLGGQAQGQATLAGAQYQVINNSANAVQVADFPVAQPGQVCYAFTVDANGHFDSGSIFPLGSYTMKEAAPSTGYLLNTDWSATFTVTADHRSFSFAGANGCPESVIRGGLKIVKEDSLLGGATSANEPLAGITFSVISENANPVVVNGKTYRRGEVVLTLPITWDGKQWSASTPADALPYGDYTLRENPAASDSSLANDYYFLNPDGQAIQIRGNGVVITKTFKNEIRPGKVSAKKVDQQGNSLPGAKFLLEWSEDGFTWQPVTHNANADVVKGGTSSGVTDGCLTSGTDGAVEFTGLYPTLHYRLTEVEAPNGYLLLPDTAWEGTLPAGDLTMTLTVRNSPGFALPMTGEFGPILACVGAALAVGCLVYLVPWKRKRES